MITEAQREWIGISRQQAGDLGINELPNNLIYSPCCDVISQFNAFSCNQQSGKCPKCQKVVTEFKDGTLISR